MWKSRACPRCTKRAANSSWAPKRSRAGADSVRSLPQAGRPTRSQGFRPLKKTRPAAFSALRRHRHLAAGAALHDVLTALARRMPGLPVILLPHPGAGPGAGAQIAAAIRTAGARAECDVLLVCRGGGCWRICGRS